jgi:hypothetical protein
MNSEAGTKRPGEGIKICVVSAEDQATRIQGAIARRAFLTGGASIPGRELQDWRHAKSELVKGLCCGLTIHDGDIWVGTDTEEFKESTIEIWVSSRHATICGNPRGSQEKDTMVFRTLELPVEVEPSAVTATLNGTLLEICFPKAHAQGSGLTLSRSIRNCLRRLH